MKSLLAFLIFALCSGGGLYLGGMQKKRAEVLAMLAELMRDYRLVMEKKRCSVREAIEQLQKTFEDKNGRILLEGMIQAWETPGNIEEAWRHGLEKICKEVPIFTLLKADEKSRLCRFFREQAMSEFNIDGRNQWTEEWENSAEKANDLYMTKGKLYGKLGILLGLALVVLML